MTLTEGRFVRLSPSGAHVASGSSAIWVDGLLELASGTTPQWPDDTTILYSRQPDGALMRYGIGDADPVVVRGPGHEPASLCTDGAGRYAFIDHGVLYTSEGRRVTGVMRPTIAGSDLCWCVDDGRQADLYREGALVARNVQDVRGMPDGRLVYTQWVGNSLYSCVRHPGGVISSSWRLDGADEYQPMVLDIASEEWVLSHTRDERLLLRSGNNGAVLATGPTFEPDAAVLPGGRVRVVWALQDGTLIDHAYTLTDLALVDETGREYPIVDLRAGVMPAVAPWPPGAGWTRRDDVTEVDIVDYLLGSQDWSRNGMHVAGDAVTYTHPFQSRVLDEGDTQGAVQHTKFGPPDTRAATWTFTDEWVGLAYDGTNALEFGYRFVVPGTDQTAALYPRMMRVGPEHRRVVDLELLDLATGDRRRLQWAGWVEAVYDGPQLGDLPPMRHALIVFEPAGDDARGWRELNIGALGLGCWYWHQCRKADGSTPDMRWIGTRHAARFVDPPLRFADALPSSSTTPAPTPDPEPSMPTALKNRDQFFAEFERVNQFYASQGGLKRDGGMVIGVVVDGVEVPSCDVVAMRQWGYDLMAGASADQIIASIRQSEEWRTKHAGEAPSFLPAQ